MVNSVCFLWSIDFARASFLSQWKHRSLCESGVITGPAAEQTLNCWPMKSRPRAVRKRACFLPELCVASLHRSPSERVSVTLLRQGEAAAEEALEAGGPQKCSCSPCQLEPFWVPSLYSASSLIHCSVMELLHSSRLSLRGGASLMGGGYISLKRRGFSPPNCELKVRGHLCESLLAHETVSILLGKYLFSALMGVNAARRRISWWFPQIGGLTKNDQPRGRQEQRCTQWKLDAAEKNRK